MAEQVQITGLNRLRRDLVRLEAGVQQGASAGETMAAAQVAARWRASAPRLTGALARSIQPGVDEVRTGVPYAGFVLKARSTGRTAADEIRVQLSALYGIQVRRRIPRGR